MSKSVEFERTGDVQVARLIGEIDLTRAAEVRVELLRAVSNQDHGLVLDMREVSYMDSAGVNVLFELAERLRSRQQGLAAVVPERAIIARLIELVNLASIVELRSTLEDAVAHIESLAPEAS